MTPKIGPRKYRAPEVETGGDYGVSADMYSFGVMIVQLIEQLRSRTSRKCAAAPPHSAALCAAFLRRIL